MDDASLVMPYIETEEPKRQKDLIDKVEPMDPKLSNASDDPSRSTLLSDREEPIRTKLRSDMVDPMCA